MLVWLQGTSAVFAAIAALVSLVRFRQTGNKGHLFLGCCFLLTAVIFGYLALA